MERKQEDKKNSHGFLQTKGINPTTTAHSGRDAVAPRSPTERGRREALLTHKKPFPSKKRLPETTYPR